MSRHMEKKLFISGKKFFERRKAAKLSQEDVADKIGASRQTVNIWEKREEIEITPEQGAKIAKAFKINIDDLTNDATSVEMVGKPKPVLSIHEDTGDLYRKFFQQHTTEDYVLVPRVIVETYEIIPKAEQEAKRKLVEDAMEQQRDFISMLKKNLEDLRKAQELGRSLRKHNVQ
jgi:transcriptional regulator with XRE-family HTH domain